MKKMLFLIFTLIFVFMVVIGYNQFSNKPNEIWIITNVTCPEITAKKGNKTAVFNYYNKDKPYYPEKKEFLQECANNARIGGLIVLSGDGYYYFFIPANTMLPEQR